jgi:hypothetical protein
MMNQPTNRDGLGAIDMQSLKDVAGGYLGPDQNTSDFPVWALKYINIAY